MSVIRASTRRRVTVAMFSVLLLVFGVIALSELRVNLLPELSYPSLTVRTEFVGAAPEEIEKLVTQPVEEQVGVVKGVKNVRSVSRTGQADVMLEFAWGTDMDLASLDVREKLELLQLPLTADRPVLLRFNPSTDPVLRLAFYSEKAQGFDENLLKQVRRFADEELKKRLEPIEGVAAVKISGGLEDEIQINIDQRRLAQLNLSGTDVVNRLREENVNVSGGRLEQGTERYLVRTVNQFQTVDEIRDLIVSPIGGRPVYLRDVARISEGYKERQAIIRTNGRESVEIAVYKEGDANTVKVAEAVLARLEQLKESLPQDLKLVTVDDQSVFIRQSISDVTQAALFGGLLAVLIIYFFLGDAWPTLVISASIPLSIITTFFLMNQADLSLNIMSLGGIALAIGLLVDNAIVVLENISRHRRRGTSILEASVSGTQEVSGAVFASTLTTVAVFLPLIFVEGIAGQLFKDQALTVTFALLVSLAVAMTVIPMLSSLRGGSPLGFPQEDHPTSEPRTRAGRGMRASRNFLFSFVTTMILKALVVVSRAVGGALGWLMQWPAMGVMKLFNLLANGYRSVLPWALNHRWVILLVATVAMGLTVAQVPRLGAELIPQLVQGQFELTVKLSPGTPLRRSDEVVRLVQSAARDIAAIDQVHAVSGTGNRIDANPTESGENIGEVLVVMKRGTGPSEEAQAVARLREAVSALPGVQAEFARPALFSFSTPLEIEVLGYELDRLKRGGELIQRALESSDRFADVRSSLEQGHPEIQVLFDQERVAALGLTNRQVSDQVVQKIRGEVATRYSFRDRKIDVLVRAREDDRSSVDDVRELIVNPASARPVTLGSVAEVVATEGPAEIHRVDQERAALISANLGYGSLKEGVAEARELLDGLQLPYGVKYRVAGQSEEMDASFKSLAFALGLAIFLVYLVMASQFESLIHPLVILFSIPLAAVGAVAALTLTGTSLSVIVFIGLIMLAGIVVNNAIVLIDLINQLRAAGSSKRDAIIEAGHSRLRPIVMTTLTTTLGLVPLVLGVGEGAEMRAPMAITVIGGLLVSTLLTLVVVPVMYDLLDRRRSAATLGSATAAEGGA
ncbi:MAG: efflux RND transporter permease subunit [Pseudomonadota bacterium]